MDLDFVHQTLWAVFIDYYNVIHHNITVPEQRLLSAIFGDLELLIEVLSLGERQLEVEPIADLSKYDADELEDYGYTKKHLYTLQDYLDATAALNTALEKLDIASKKSGVKFTNKNLKRWNYATCN